MNNHLFKEKIFNKAFQLHSKGNISEAAKYYQYFLNQGFKDHRVFTNYGSILKDLGKLEEAELSYRKAIELKPDFALAHSNLGNTLSDLGKLEEAELSYRKAIELKPDFSEAHSNLGNALKDLGKLEEAELSYRKAIELKPDFSEAHSNLGNALSDLRKFEEAELSYRKAIEIKPDLAMAHANLGNTLSDLGKLEKAELSYRKAIKLKPDLAMAHHNLAGVLLNLGKSEELILLSKSTLKSKSFNKGYKLRASLLITISNLLREDYDATLFNLNNTKELISQGALNMIEQKKNRKYISTFFEFLNSLFPQLEKEKINHGLKIIPHIGESHCLSFANQTLSLSSQLKQIKPVLITGGKAWHFANNKYNQWKDSLTYQIKRNNYGDEIFISFGEIDCRKKEGILNYARKNNQDISQVCEKTIEGYLNYMEKVLSQYFSKRYYFGIPAPCIDKNFYDDFDIQRIKIVKTYNSFLKKKVLSRGSYFLNVYDLTSNKNGRNNKLHMCDKIHLSPKCLSILFENYLYKPNRFN